MHPILFKSSYLYIYSYGFTVAIGFAAAVFLIYRHASEFGIDKAKVIDAGMVMLISGLAGARLLYVLTNLKYYIAHPVDIINLPKGGLVEYGGFIFGLIACIIFAKLSNINFWVMADLIAPYIALAQSIGRIGCFLNGCCYGIPVSPSSYIPCVNFPGESVLRHPTQIYLSCEFLLLFVALRIWQKRSLFKGEIFLLYVIFHSLIRFVMEFLRGDNPKIFYGFTMSQLISAGMFAIFFSSFLYRLSRCKKSS